MEIINYKPNVSVIIDTYNYAQFIETAIESVLSQTFPQNDIEIIVIDDGSTDNTSTIVKKYKDKIKYIYKENGGQASAFNLGFDNASGEYIILLDSDDYCLPNRVETIVEEFERYKNVGCILNTRQVIKKNNVIHEQSIEFHNLEINNDTIYKFIKCSYGTSRTSLRKSFLSEILPLPEKGLIIEADLFLNLAIYWFCKVSCLNEELTVYRIHGDNLFSISDIERLPRQIECMEYALQYVRKIAKSSPKYSLNILDKLLLPYELGVKEKIYSLNTKKGISTRKDTLLLEFNKIKANWEEWNNLYKIYKLLRLPLLLLLSPKTFIRLSNFYYKHKLYNLRNTIFSKRA